MAYIITSPVSVSNSVPVTLNLSNTSSSQNWSLSTNNSDQLTIGSTTTPNTIILSPSRNVQLNNVVNSIIDSTTNTVTADKLRSATTTISIGGATAPTTGQALVATSGTSATWQSVVPIATGLITLGAGGTFTVLMNPLSATSRITVNIQPSQAPLGVVWVSNITLNTSFTISSTNAGDVGVNVYYQIYSN